MIHAFGSLAALKAADPADLIAGVNGGDLKGFFNWTLGNFAGQADDMNVIASNSVPLATGAWLREQADSILTFAPGQRTRSVADKLEDEVLLTDFPGVTDNEEDDQTVGIQNALDSGRKIWVPARKFRYSRLVSTHDDLSLRGPGTFVKIPIAAVKKEHRLFEVMGDRALIADLTFDVEGPPVTEGEYDASLHDSIRVYGRLLERWSGKGFISAGSDVLSVCANSATGLLPGMRIAGDGVHPRTMVRHRLGDSTVLIDGVPTLVFNWRLDGPHSAAVGVNPDGTPKPIVLKGLGGGDSATIDNVTVLRSHGNAFRIEGASNARITNCTVQSAFANGVLVSNQGADFALISGNRISNTQTQNCIYVTSTDGGNEAGYRIYGISIIGNVCRNSGDTGIEVGHGTFFAMVVGNQSINCRNPHFLQRDAYGVIWDTNIGFNEDPSVQNADANEEHISIGALRLNDIGYGQEWDSRSVFKNVSIYGRSRRAFMYLAQNGFALENVNYDPLPGRSIDPAGANLGGTGLALADPFLSNISMKGGQIRGCQQAINFNFGSAANAVRESISIDGVHLLENAHAFYGRNMVYRDVRVSRCRVQKVKTAVWDVTDSIIAPRDGASDARLLYSHPHESLAGFAGAPVRYIPASLPILGMLTDERSRLVELPTQQGYDEILLRSDENSFGPMTIAVLGGGGPTVLVSGGRPDYGSGQVVQMTNPSHSGAAHIWGSANLNGTNDWAVGYISDALRIRRCGPTQATRRWCIFTPLQS